MRGTSWWASLDGQASARSRPLPGSDEIAMGGINMNTVVTCNYCGEMFCAENENIVTRAEGDLEIQYLTCSNCNRKFLVLATDPEMRGLIAQRQQIAKKIKMARLAKAKPQTLKRLAQELDAVKKVQERKLPGLKRLGRAALAKWEGDHAEETNH
ncbi:MAG: hypothetical protein NC131_08245 [Roseburia sp.]|nr:hypothetical protein [Roseburia sp.]